jgi:hypothetical protein
VDGSAHLLGVGKIVGNLHSLELLLRLFLCEAKGEIIEFPKSQAGTMPETHLTNFMSLGDLIKSYNATLSATEKAHSVDPTVVQVRDAIAHGRLTSLSGTFPLTLYKFGRPDAQKMVPIEFAEQITEQWLDGRRHLILDQIRKVHECGKARKYKSFSA